MKLIRIAIYISLTFFSCKNNYSHEFTKFKNLAINKNAIIISCLRCDCVIDALNYTYEKDSSLLRKYDIYIDGKCKTTLSKKIKTINYSQGLIDSTSLSLYNMLIIKRNKNKFSYELIENEDAKNILQILE